MDVHLQGVGRREGVQHVHVRTSGDVVLRYSGHKETVDGDDVLGVEVSPPR
jgi:hypothetical protein